MSPDSQTASQPPKPIIIIKRKKGGHGGHHGGAWKVAYADFVTAMMALFIVLWLMSADEEVKKAISFYFNNPSGPGKLMGTASAGVGNAIEVPRDDMKRLAEKIQQALLKVPNFQNLKDHVEITITSDGLRIELLETEAGMFFESGRAVPTESGAQLLAQLAAELGKLPNSLLIEGHTDSIPYSHSRDDGYSNWELSADRANSARKLMQANGVRPEQVGQVRGYADRQLRHPDNPKGPSNRRISIIVQYLPPPAEAKSAEDAKPDGETKPAGESKPASEAKSAGEAKPAGEAVGTKPAKQPPKKRAH
jgi:chemotaxis protein MotB